MGGTAIIVLAVVIAPLPGPGFIILAPVGVAVLATEFLWARRLQGQLKDQARRLQRQADAIAKRTNPLLVPLVLLVYGGAFALVWRETDLPRSVLAATCVAGLMPLGYWAYRTLRGARRAPNQQRDTPEDPEGNRGAPGGSS